MVDELKALFDDLDLEQLRVKRPSKFLFLCGGAIPVDPQSKTRPENLRDYICRVRPLKWNHEIVLAESATDLYQATSYHDLISFEEDIARIAAVVMVIAESAGSLAELGAFSANETIRKSLRVIISQNREQQKSFVRYGPVERVKKTERGYLGIFPWRTHSNGWVILKSAQPHYSEIRKFIFSHVNSTPNSVIYNRLNESSVFYLIYWIINLCVAVSPVVLHRYLTYIIPQISEEEMRNKIYCMQLARWVGMEAYSNKDYFYSLYDDDPFDYKFRPGTKERVAIRRKLPVTTALRKAEKVPKHVIDLAIQSRSAGRKWA